MILWIVFWSLLRAAPQDQHCLSNIPITPKASSLGLGKRLVGDKSGTADSRDNAYHRALCSAIKAQRKEETEAAFVIKAFVLARDHWAHRGPTYQEIAGPWLLVGSRNHIFLLNLTCLHIWPFSLLNCLYLYPFSSYFLHLRLAIEGVAGWIPRSQPWHWSYNTNCNDFLTFYIASYF